MLVPLSKSAVSNTIAGAGPTGKVLGESEVVRVVGVGVGAVLMTKIRHSWPFGEFLMNEFGQRACKIHIRRL